MEWQRQHECATSGGDAALDANDDGTLLCKFTRQSSGQHALLSASPQLARVLTRAFSLSQPFTIGSIDASSDMFRVCAAKLMLRNGYCVLASSRGLAAPSSATVKGTEQHSANVFHTRYAFTHSKTCHVLHLYPWMNSACPHCCAGAVNEPRQHSLTGLQAADILQTKLCVPMQGKDP